MHSESMKFKARKITPGYGDGEALVSKDSICYSKPLFDTHNGKIREEGHALNGKSIAGKVLVYPSEKGSPTAAYMLYGAILNKKGPVAILMPKAGEVTIAAAVMGNIPLMHKPEINLFEIIRTGDYVRVDADKGVFTVARGKSFKKKP